MPYELNEARELVLKACKELVEHKLIARTWGNISARISPTQFVITPSGKDYASLTPEDIVVVNLKGKYSGDITPSSEKGVHAKCYKTRPDVNFVIHTHQPFASALSVLGHDIKLGSKVSEQTKMLIGSKIICAEYGRNASRKLADAVGASLKSNPDCNHVLMKFHGALCLGSSYDSAFRVAYSLENLSKKVYEHYTCEENKSYPNELITVQSVPVNILNEDGKSTERIGEWIIHAKTPYITQMSNAGSTVKAYLDDLAQIAGTAIKCAPEGSDKKKILHALGNNNAVFVKGDGAYCFGNTFDEAEAVAIVLEKACLAAYLARIKEAEPLGLTDAMHDRYVYIKKYSKLK